MKKTFLLLASVCALVLAFGQQNATKWQAKIEPQKVFIENKGQFDAVKTPDRVLFGTDDLTGMFLFTKTGISYRMEKRKAVDKDEHEAGKVDDAEDEDEGSKVDVISMQWIGANPGVQVTATEEQSSYFNFGMGQKSIDHARTFKKVTYKNLYPNIDVEYVFHPITGIEYSLILHPGADISNVKMQYSSEETILLSEKGEIHVPTIFGDITDHAPLTYYAANKAQTISSAFVLENGYVGFKLGNYNNTQTLVIDPWTTTPALPTTNTAFYIKADSLGDAYVYGGSNPYTVLKYNPTGGLIWTYSSNFNENNDWFGAMAVDHAGNAFITDGTGGTLAKISPAGSLVWSHTTTTGPALSLEFWSLDFNCDQTELYIGGMRGPAAFSPIGVWYGAIYQMNMTNGAITTYKEVSIVPHTGGFAINEVRSMCMSPNGNIYALSLDTIASLTQGLAYNYRQMHNYNYDYYLPYSQGGTGQGSNNIRATSYFIYSTDGATLDKRDINTGNILTSVSIPGGSAQQNSGIAIDTCGNVYVGSQRTVEKFDANLNLLGSINTPSAVYDVSIGVNGDILACGQSFAVALAYNACPQVAPICYRIFTANTTPANPHCLGQCTGTATAATTNGTGPYKYLWSNSGTTQTVNNLCPGQYSVTVTDLSNNSTAVGYGSIDSAQAFVSNVVTYPPSCGQTNGKAVATIITGGSSPYTYSWSGGATNQVDSNLTPGPYSVTVTDTHGCSASASATLVQSSSLLVTPTSTPAACGGSNGTAGVTVTGAPGPFQYHWTGGQTTSTISGLSAGTYNVTVQDTSSATSIFWTEDFSSGGTGWTLNDTLHALNPNGNSANQWIVNNDNTCTCTTGNYLHITNTSSSACLECMLMPAGTCQYLELPAFTGEGNFATDVRAVSPAISTVGKSNITLNFTWLSLGNPGADYGLVDLSSDGGLTWTRLPKVYDNAYACTLDTVIIPSNYENITDFKFAFEWINVAGSFTGAGANPPGFAIDSISLKSGSSSCPATASVTVTTSTNITLTPAAVATTCGHNNGSASVTVSGSSGYTYSWSNGGTAASITNVPSGTYTVTVSASGCSATGSAVVNQSFGVTLTPSATATTCGINNGSAAVGIASGLGPFTYTWSNGGTAASITNVPAGSYQVTVSGGGCSSTASEVVDTSTAITLSGFGGRAGCTSTGTANVTVTSGNGPFTYLWSNGATAAAISALSAGNYTVTVTGAGSCAAIDTVTVTSAVNGVTLSSSATPSGCSDSTGSATATPTSGTSPFIYAWSNGATTSSIQNITVGSYTVTVTGNGGCSATASVIVTGSGTFSITTSATPAGCGSNNGSAEVTNANNGSFTYTWSNGATTDTIRNLASGTYTVTVLNGGACSGTASATINPSGGSIAIQAQPTTICPGDTSQICAPTGYTAYHWNVGASTQCINVTQPGNYYLTVTGNGNCTATSNQVTIAVNAPDSVSITQHEDTLRATGALTYQWYFNGAPISGATSSMYVATQVGSYYAEGTGSNGCSGKSKTIVLKGITGIDAISDASDVKVYPNPLANGSWHLDVTNDWIGSDCEVYDAAGRLIFRTEIKGTQSEIELNIAQGIYLMRINSAQKNYAIKLIKL